MKQIVLNSLFSNENLCSFQYLRDLRFTQALLMTYVQPLIGSVTAILNLLVLILCIIFYLKTLKRNHKPAFVFIGFLSFLDMMVGSFNAAYGISLEEDLTGKDAEDCKIGFMFGGYFQSASLNVLLALTIDRFIFIKKPLHYPLIMTQCRTWLLLFFALCFSSISSVRAYFTFVLPPDDAQGHICLTVHVFAGWQLIASASSYFLILVSVIVIYSVMLMEFRQSRNKLKELQRENEEEDHTKSKLSFHQERFLFKKHFITDVPGLVDDQIQTFYMKYFENGRKMTEKEKPGKKKKRSRSSVVKRMGVLVSHAKAAKYIIILVVTLMVSWTPFFIYSSYEAITHMAKGDLIQPNSTVNAAEIKACLNDILNNKNCNITMEIENEHEEIVQEKIRYICHTDEVKFFEFLLGVFMSLLNSMMNPVLYAFWYADFRTHLFKIPQWFKKKKGQQPDDFNFKIQIIKI